jgi:DnaJ domain
MGRFREGQYFCFCLGHVREYNLTYNYFDGMSAEAIARFQRDALVGHRPTWTMGMFNRGRGCYDAGEVSYRGDNITGMRKANLRGYPYARPQPRYGVAALKALDKLGLDDSVDMVAIKARYKDLVKRLHPDANAGDRSNEDKLREIIRAYAYLRSTKHV